MKKIIDVNIAGVNFSMEDDAYFLLKNYLGRFEASIPDKREAREVMEDVEARVMEIFNEKRSFPNQVIGIELVRTVIEHLGEVDENEGETLGSEATSNQSQQSEEYAGAHTYENNSQTYTDEYGYVKGEKYLFRNPDDKKIAGICSGLAAYFGIDVTIVRVLFAITAWVYGTALFVYIILWICVSEAKTVADKLKMRGQATTLDNMRRYAAEHKQQNV